MPFRFPVLNEKVNFSFPETNRLIVSIYDQELTIDFSDSKKVSAARQLLEKLSARESISDILSEESAQEVYLQLVKLRLVSEGVQAQPGFVNALAFQSELEAWFEYKHTLDMGETEFDTLFFEGKLDKAIIIKFIIEYFHVTRLCSASVGSSIAYTSSYTSQYYDFFKEEYGHEKLIKRSLIELGFTEQDIENLEPRYTTRALMNRLKIMSLTDLESFSSVIFLFEGTRSNADEYLNALEKYGFSNGVIRPQRIHEDINSSGDHDLESLEMMKTFGEFSNEKAAQIKKNAIDTYSMMNWMNNSFLET